MNVQDDRQFELQ